MEAVEAVEVIEAVEVLRSGKFLLMTLESSMCYYEIHWKVLHEKGAILSNFPHISFGCASRHNI